MATITKDDVKNMNGPQLVEAFNQLSDTKVKRFSNRDAGMRRVLALLGDGPEPKAKKPREKKEKKERAPRSSEIKAGKDSVGEPREGTKRAAILALTDRKGGATREEIAQAAGWDSPLRVRESMRIIARRHGRNVTEENGTVRTTKA